MQRRFINLLMPLMLICASGCAHVHTTAAVDVKDMGEHIHTKYKYKIGNKPGVYEQAMLASLFKDNGLASRLADRWRVDEQLMKDFAKWQPDVFDVEGIPITFLKEQVVKDGPGERKVGWSDVLSLVSCFVVPVIHASHVHETWPFRINGETGNRISLEACVYADVAWGWTPLRWLLCWWDRDTCHSGKRKFDSHVMNVGTDTFIDDEVKKRAMAYGLAVRLKELEDSGQIGDNMAVNTIASHEIAKILSDTHLEIVQCENTTGKDFEYDFVLRNKGGGKLKLVDYERIRSAFRAAIVNTYCMKHPEVNPRSLVTDFTKYTMGGECITGRVSVLTIEVNTVFYDAAKRTGWMSAKIGANQFEDVRRYIRNHIEELATRSNIVMEGDSLPKGAIFYTGDERLAENGLLEVEFKTE